MLPASVPSFAFCCGTPDRYRDLYVQGLPGQDQFALAFNNIQLQFNSEFITHFFQIFYHGIQQ